MSKSENFLEHHGVKGMKWGVIRDRASKIKGGVSNLAEKIRNKTTDTTPDGETVAIVKPGAKVTAKGGKKVAPHNDAIKVAIDRQKAAKSTTDSLSTEDLQKLVNRMNLEKQYSQLVNPSNGKNQGYIAQGRKTVDEIMKTKKTYDKLMEDPFVKDAVNGLAKDLGADKLVEKLVKKVVK